MIVSERENVGCWQGIEPSDSDCSVRASVPGETVFSKLTGIKEMNVAQIAASGVSSHVHSRAPAFRMSGCLLEPGASGSAKPGAQHSQAEGFSTGRT